MHIDEMVHVREEQTKSCIVLNADIVWRMLDRGTLMQFDINDLK